MAKISSHSEFYDPDFDSHERHEANDSALASLTIEVQLTPKMIFLVGFAIGLLVMALPLAYIIARASVN